MGKFFFTNCTLHRRHYTHHTTQANRAARQPVIDLDKTAVDRQRPSTRLEAGGWRPSTRLEAGGWRPSTRLETGGWRLEAGGGRLEAGGRV